MSTFIERFENVVQEAHEFVKKVVLNKGTVEVVKLDEEGEVAEEHEDFFYEAPCVGFYGKYGTYDEYAILSLEARDGEVVVKTRGRGEADDDREFQLEQVEPEQIVVIADLIQE